MNGANGRNDDSQQVKPDPLAVAETPLGNSPTHAVESPSHPPTTGTDEDVTSEIGDNKGDKEIKQHKPLLVRVIEDDELNAFEQKTLKYAKAGFVVGFVTVFLAGLTAIIFYGQFKEAAGQTDLLASLRNKKEQIPLLPISRRSNKSPSCRRKRKPLRTMWRPFNARCELTSARGSNLISAANL